MNLKTFRKIVRQVEDLAKSDLKFDIAVRNDSDWQPDSESAFFEPVHFNITSHKQLYETQEILQKPIAISASLKKLVGSAAPSFLDTVVVHNYIVKQPALKSKYPTLKFYSNTIKQQYYDFVLYMITAPPLEKIEGDVTYRYIGDERQALMCLPHTHQLYNYLDEGFFFIKMGKTGKIIIANELTVDVFLCLAMLFVEPRLAKELPHECYLNAATAKLLRIKFEKDARVNKDIYNRIRINALAEYEKVVNSNLVRKLVTGELKTATYNDIRLTAESAVYETVSIQAKDLLKKLETSMVFDDRTDIYTLTRSFILNEINILEGEAFDPNSKEEQSFSKSFNINGINITIKRTSDNTRRYVNDVAINISELEPVCYRASCFDNQEIFDKFVKSIHDMSLKYHDALASGVPMKIHDGLSSEDYRKATADPSSPRIRFKKNDKGDFMLMIDDTKAVKVKLGDAIKELATLNRKINDGYSVVDGYSRRDAKWGRKKLAEILKECCTFDKKQLVVGEDKKPILDKDGKKQYTKIKECELSDEHAKAIEEMSRKFYEKALEKSKIFLATALKITKSEEITYQGQPAYLVPGKTKKYVVFKKTNQVANFETGGHICIVEAGHKVSVGADATAARIYACAADSVVLKNIGRLY